MAENTKLQYIVELLTQGDTTRATAELKKLNDAGKATGAGMAEIGRQFKAAFALIAGSALIHQSIEAFLEQERAVLKLNAALKAMGEFTPELSKQMQDLAEAMSRVSLFADDAILNVIARLTAAGAKARDIERLTQAVLDLSTLMDRDLNRATQAFTLALNGEVAALKQAGIAIDETTTATEQFNSALEQIERKAGGQAREQVRGLSADFIQLKKDIDEAKETAGSFFLTIYSSLRRAALDVASGFKGEPGPFDQATRPQLPLTAESNAALMRALGLGTGPTPPVTTAALSAKDDLEMLEQIRRISEATAKFSQDKAKSEKEYQKSLEAQAEEILDEILQQQQRITEEQQFQIDQQRLKAEVMITFSAGLSHAIVSAFEEGDKAFQKFAQNFLRAVAEMILQMLILRAVSSIFGGAGGAPVAAAAGGQFARRFAGGGMAELNGPTYFPSFNVLAGEAGREVMTVLSRPRLERINGVPAQVGSAGGQRLAITSADALARAGGGAGGKGGEIHLLITMSPEVKAQVVQASVERVTVEMQQDTTLSRAAKNLTK